MLMKPIFTRIEAYLSRDGLAVIVEIVSLLFAILGLDFGHFPRFSSIENDVDVGRLAKSEKTLLDGR